MWHSNHGARSYVTDSGHFTADRVYISRYDQLGNYTGSFRIVQWSLSIVGIFAAFSPNNVVLLHTDV